MTNEKWERGNEKWEMRKGKWERGNEKGEMRKGKWEREKRDGEGDGKKKRLPAWNDGGVI